MTISPKIAEPQPLPHHPRRRRLTVRACIGLGLLALIVIGGFGTAGAIALLGDAEGNVEGY